MIIGEAMKLIKIFSLPLAFFICMGAVQVKELSPRFVAADANKDEKLSKDEVVAFLEKKAEERAGKRFLQVDKNADGFVTPEEAKQAKQKEKEKEADDDTESEDKPL